MARKIAPTPYQELKVDPIQLGERLSWAREMVGGGRPAWQPTWAWIPVQFAILNEAFGFHRCIFCKRCVTFSAFPAVFTVGFTRRS